MRISTLKKLIELVENSGIDELEISRWGRKIRISRNTNSASPRVNPPHSLRPVVEDSHPLPETATTLPSNDNFILIKSPIVGTFYGAPSPDAESYVKENDIVVPGQVLCIIEAMKLMNEILAETRGRIAKILVENAQPVEYGQLLFVLEPT